MATFIDERALVARNVVLGEDARVWAFTQIREGARLGPGTSIGSHSYIDADVVLGANCKIQSGVMLFKGTTIEDGVFVGPGAIVTNDRHPRAVNPDMSRREGSDWHLVGTHIERGASLGAASVVVAGVRIGRFAMVAAGAVVTKDVGAHELVVGVPAAPVGHVCSSGHRLADDGSRTCETCREVVAL